MSRRSHEALARTLTQVAEGDRVTVETSVDVFDAVATNTETDESGVRVTVVPEDGDDWLELRATRVDDDWEKPAIYRLQYPDDAWTKRGDVTNVTIE